MKEHSVTMDASEEFDRKTFIVPPRSNMVFKMSMMTGMREKTSVEIEMPTGSSCETVGTHSNASQVSSNMSHSTVKSRSSDSKYKGADAWWSVGDFLQPGIAKQTAKLSSGETNDDDTWDLSDSIVDLYKESNKYDGVHNYSPVTRMKEVDIVEWIEQDTNNGFVRVHRTETDRNPRLFPCTLSTTAQKLCIQCGMPPNSLHIQLNGDIIKRLEPFDSPLALQNEYLQNIGYTDQRKIQEVGAMEDVSYLVKFYAGKPVSDSTYSRNQLTSFAYVRKGKLIYQWVRRLCVITGTRLLIYRDKNKDGKPTIVQLAKGDVEEVNHVKGHDHVLKLTSTLQGERSVYLSFTDEKEYSKWKRKTKKATAKLPTKADLSNCHLEFLPETVFINDGLEILNLRHNVLKERPIEEDIYTIGWLDDLPRFVCLRSLNLADNNLRCFPIAVCKMRTLTELNLASNKIEDIPPDIADLENLQMLHLHNNRLTTLPEDMCRMRNLLVLVLAFNHFSTVPSILLNSHDSLLRIDSLIMAGNKIARLHQEVLQRMNHIKKIDFRMNRLSLTPSEMAKFHLLELVTHLDVRDNNINDLDVRSLRSLEYLNCERSKIHSLQVSGGAIKTLLAMQNEISMFSVSPKPEWLATLDLSNNLLESLPGWISNCFFLVHLNASHNKLKQLPDRILCDAQKLRVLQLSQNHLSELPREINSAVLEELSLEHNQLDYLPSSLFKNLPRLKYICLTNNKLVEIPEPNHDVYQNKLQDLYLSANQLGDNVVPIVSMFQKLKILHLAYNQITELHDRDIRKLESLQELNISGNFLRHIPRSLGRHGKLQALRCNANLLKELPDFRYSTNLKVLEVGSNRLIDVSVTNLMASNVNLLDISGNPEMQVNSSELRGIKVKKKVCMVDIKGQNRSLLDLRTAGFEDLQIPWQSGLSQTSGIRNKISVTVLNRPKFNEGKEGLFAVFDGGRNDEVPRTLASKIAGLVEEELKHPVTNQEYLKYSLLAAHRKLKLTGQKIGASGAVCHLSRRNEGSSQCVLNVANVGDTEVILCRRGEAIVLSKLFMVTRNKEEMERIHKSGGIVTEDNKINGVTNSSRLLGSSYLFPHIIPDPHHSATVLQPEDQLIIIANQGLWKYMSYQEAVNEVIDIPDPVLAAKKLQDLSQGYHSQENIGVLVIRLMVSTSERNRMRELLQAQFEREQRLLAELKVRDIEREEIRKRQELEEAHDSVPMDIVKLKGGRKRKQIGMVFNGVEGNGEHMNGAGNYDEIDAKTENPSHKKYVNEKTDPTLNWESVLQKRLTEEVKDKELIHAMRVEECDPYLLTIESDENWSTTTKLKGQVKERTVTLPPTDAPIHSPNITLQPPPNPPLQRRQIIPEAAQLSTESLEFKRELKHPLNVDRDAILFHNMQLTRHKSHHLSSASIDSTQSDPAYSSIKEISQGQRSASHSIEVLLHGPTAVRTKHLGNKEFGGSYKIPGTQETMEPPHSPTGESCPTDMPMSDRLKMLEDKGFLPNSKTDVTEEIQMKVEEAEIDSLFQSVNNIPKSDETEVKKDVIMKDGFGDIIVQVIDAEDENSEKEVPKSKGATKENNLSKTDSMNGDHSSEGSSEILIMRKDLSDDPSEFYATVRKVKAGKNVAKLINKETENSKLQQKNVETPNIAKGQGHSVKSKTLKEGPAIFVDERIKQGTHHKKAPKPPQSQLAENIKTATHTSELRTKGPPITNDLKPKAPPIPPRVPLTNTTTTDMNSNSIKSLEDLLTYNRLKQQQDKMTFKTTPKAAPPPPPVSTPETMVTKTASQRSIIITYL